MWPGSEQRQSENQIGAVADAKSEHWQFDEFRGMSEPIGSDGPTIESDE